MSRPEQPRPERSRPEHPQPVGAFGLPAGMLLVKAGPPAVEQARRDLVAGRLPTAWPPELRGHQLAHAGDPEAALAFFDGEDPVDRYNRWLLDPQCESSAEVRSALPPGLAPLVDVVAYTLRLGQVPATDLGDLPAEVAALVLATGAAAAAEQGDGDRAADLLESAGRAAGPHSPALAGVMLGNAGTLMREHGRTERARDLLGEASDALTGTDLADVRAEFLHQRGAIAQEAAARGTGDVRELLQEAVQYYYDGLQLVSEESAPHVWASLQMNLATAHLASPMTQASDQLRLGVATQALRACRRVFTPEEDPEPWSAATVNLANALVYTPSTHQGDNLVEAVELYELVLTSGVRARDPLGRARVLANQGNALAHLGIFDQARAKLVEARFLFEEQLDHDCATAVRSVLDEIARNEATTPCRDELADLARQAEQLSRMPRGEAGFTSGMGVRIGTGATAGSTAGSAVGSAGGSTAGDQTLPPPKPTVTVLPAGSAPRRPDQSSAGRR